MSVLTDQERVKIIAAACHSAWYAYTVLGLGESGRPWEMAPEWQKASIRDAVRFLDGYMDDMEKSGRPFLVFVDLCEASHENWMRHKREQGWKWGTVKDEIRKTHPNMIPYLSLSPNQRKKDEVVVRAYLAMRSVLNGDRRNDP